MHKYLQIALTVLVALAFTSTARAGDDGVLIKVTKSSEHRAKVSFVAPSKEQPVVVRIKFADGADWTTVKDVYTVSSSTASGLESKRICLSVAADGTLSFRSKK